MKAIIVEDDDGAQTVLKSILQPLVTNIKVVESMKDALTAIAEAGQIELITVDLGLPDSQVEETITKHIKEFRALHPGALIIVITGQELENLEERVIAEGADGLILKQGEKFNRKGFLTLLASIVAKYAKDPKHYKRSVELMEKVSRKIAELSALPGDDLNTAIA